MNFSDFYFTEAKKYDHIDFKPPVSVANAAQKAIDWKKKYGKEVKGGTRVGWTRASQLAKRETLSPETVKRMKAFFDRHDGNQKVEKGKKPYQDNGKVAWQIWGGNAGRSWANKIVRQMEAADKKVNESINNFNINNVIREDDDVDKNTQKHLKIGKEIADKLKIEFVGLWPYKDLVYYTFNDPKTGTTIIATDEEHTKEKLEQSRENFRRHGHEF